MTVSRLIVESINLASRIYYAHYLTTILDDPAAAY